MSYFAAETWRILQNAFSGEVMSQNKWQKDFNLK